MKNTIVLKNITQDLDECMCKEGFRYLPSVELQDFDTKKVIGYCTVIRLVGSDLHLEVNLGEGVSAEDFDFETVCASTTWRSTGIGCYPPVFLSKLSFKKRKTITTIGCDVQGETTTYSITSIDPATTSKAVNDSIEMLRDYKKFEDSIAFPEFDLEHELEFALQFYKTNLTIGVSVYSFPSLANNCFLRFELHRFFLPNQVIIIKTPTYIEVDEAVRVAKKLIHIG